MAIVDPESESEVLRASVILLIRLQKIRFGQPVKEKASNLLVGVVSMQVVIEEVLKGDVRQKVGEPFQLNVPRRSTESGRVMDNYGLWSMVQLSEGIKYVAFCRGQSDDATLLLTEENCEQLVSPDVALEDTRTALELEKERQSIAGVLVKAARRADKHGDIFARYVAAKTKHNAIPPLESVRKSSPLSLSKSSQLTVEDGTSELPDDAFEALITLLEAPKTAAKARATYLSSIYEDLGMMASPPRRWVMRLIQAMFRLLSLPEAASLHNAIRQVYLPNALGLNNPPARFRAEEIFQSADDERAAAARSLRQPPQDESALRLIRWLEGSDR